MSAFANLGFETAGAGAGDAEGWTRSSVATAEEVAAYGGTLPIEGFEAGWENDGFLFSFADVDLARAAYDASAGPPLDREAFEVMWDSNESFQFTLGPTSVATYGTGAKQQEDFEGEWGNDDLFTSWADVDDEGVPAELFESGWLQNELAIFSFAPENLAVGQFNTLPGAGPSKTHEDFEDQWPTLMAGVMGVALYDTSGTAQGFEDFEESWTDTLA